MVARRRAQDLGLHKEISTLYPIYPKPSFIKDLIESRYCKAKGRGSGCFSVFVLKVTGCSGLGLVLVVFRAKAIRILGPRV